MSQPRRKAWTKPPIVWTRCIAIPFWRAIQEVCTHRVGVCWRPMCAPLTCIRVVEAGVPPERVMGDFKAYASRQLNRMGLDEPDRKRWTGHGSTMALEIPTHRVSYSICRLRAG